MITIISGTNRPQSNTRKVAGVVTAIYARSQTPHQLLDLQELPADLVSPAAYALKPPAFERFSRAVVESHGLVVITPEYNGGMPGILKLFLDMLPFKESFDRRPVCFVGLAAGMWGALRPVEQLQAVFGHGQAHIFPTRVFLPGIGGLLTADGQFKTPEPAERLARQAEGFLAFVQTLRRQPPG